MSKTIVNNNLKLKEGGGLVNDANGLQVDTTIYPATPTMPAYKY